MKYALFAPHLVEGIKEQQTSIEAMGTALQRQRKDHETAITRVEALLEKVSKEQRITAGHFTKARALLSPPRRTEHSTGSSTGALLSAGGLGVRMAQHLKTWGVFSNVPDTTAPKGRHNAQGPAQPDVTSDSLHFLTTQVQILIQKQIEDRDHIRALNRQREQDQQRIRQLAERQDALQSELVALRENGEVDGVDVQQL